MQTCLPTEGGGQGISADGWMELLFDEDAQNFPYIYIMCLSDIIQFTIEFSAVGYELRPLCVLGVEKTCCERRMCYRWAQILFSSRCHL